MATARRPKFPPGAVRLLAAEQGYSEREVGEQERGWKMTFRHLEKYGCGGSEHQSGPVTIQVWFTTGNVRTELNHPSRGGDPLHRDCSLASLSQLKCIFINPRLHTNVGYRRRQDKRRRVFSNEGTTQEILNVESPHRNAKVSELISNLNLYDEKHRTVVVAGSKRRARDLARQFRLSAVRITGGLRREYRAENLRHFQEGEVQVLIISSFAAITAIGLEIPLVTNIINLSLNGGMWRYRQTIAVLRNRGLATTILSSQDLAKSHLMIKLRTFLMKSKQNIPGFLLEQD